MDKWDVIEGVSVLLLVVGTAAIYWQAGVILAGLIGLLLVFSKEFARASRSTDARNESAE